MTDEIELKLCPFCGGKADVFCDIKKTYYYVECYSEINDYDCCEARTAEYDKEELAIDSWNIRAKYGQNMDK